MNREQTEQEVAQIADTWATAEFQGDTVLLEKCLSDDFVGVGPLGFLLSRQEWLARHQSRCAPRWCLSANTGNWLVSTSVILASSRLSRDPRPPQPAAHVVVGPICGA